MKTPYLLFLVMLVVSSCQKSRDCFNEPAALTIEFVNENGENIITNRALVEGMFEFKKELGGHQNKAVAYAIDENDHVVLRGLELSEGSQQYKFLSLVHSFAFVLKGKNYENCGGVYISELLLHNTEYVQKEGYIQVKLIRR